MSRSSWRQQATAKLQAFEPTREEKANDPDYIFQETVFQPIRKRGRTGTKTVTRLDVYFDSLVQCSMRGDTSATRELRCLSKIIDKKQPVETTALSEARNRFEEHLAQHRRLQAGSKPFRVAAYCKVENDLKMGYFEKHGTHYEGSFELPSYLQPTPVEVLNFKRIMLEELEQERRGAMEAGYAKPPVETRWTKGQSGNPSGQRKAAGAELTGIKARLLQRFPIMVEGRKTKLTSAAIMFSKLIELAIKGDPKARLEVRHRLVELDKRNLLSPPPPQPKRRRSRSKSSPELISKFVPALKLAELDIKESMERHFIEVFGPNEHFKDDIRRERAAVREAMKAVKADA